MNCTLCGIAKLSSEFPIHPITKTCVFHVPAICLRCIINGRANTCPQCNAQVTQQDKEQCKKLLEEALMSPPCVPENQATNQPKSQIFVSLLEGNQISLPFTPTGSILDLKRKISEQLNIPVNNQRLSFQGKELKTRIPSSNNLASFQDYNIPGGATIQLIRILYAIAEGSDLRKIVFDLFWGYPSSRQDYLDGSCLVFNRTGYLSFVDYSYRSCFENNSLRHSGDLMDNANKRGHHIINVDLTQIPTSATHLFFTLSAYNCDKIAMFPNPSVQVFDERDRTKNLCNYSFSGTGNARAVILCCLKRGDGSSWTIEQYGTLSGGNVLKYSEMISTTTSLIARFG